MLVKIVCMALGAVVASVTIGLVAVVREDSRKARVRDKAWEKTVEERIARYEND